MAGPIFLPHRSRFESINNNISPYCIQDILAGDELLVDYGERFWESQEVSLIHASLMEGYEESLPRN
jgi:SET domain-containing protein